MNLINGGLSISSYCYLPNGLIMQWTTGSISTSEGTKITAFPTQFPTACLWASVTTGLPTPGIHNDAFFELVSFNTTNVTVYHQSTNTNHGSIYPIIFAIGY
jgi:hypothetical protein